MASNDLCVCPHLMSWTKLTIQKACALLEGLEAGLDRSALVRPSSILGFPTLHLADLQRQAQSSTSAAPAGQRTIPKFERHTHTPTPVEVEGIEKPMKAVAI
jgi:cytoplasmic tRNA 2-thiolation protein 1